jgi:AcrR family transcriptional regulator
MRPRDENKRKLILEVATKLFKEKSFHQVRLDDVASAAGIGKGTLYIYFRNKEELYYCLVYDGLAGLVDRLRLQLEPPNLGFRDKIKIIIGGVVEFSVQHPQLFEVMRTVGVPDASSQWDAKRRELTQLTEDVLRQGTAAGEFSDPRPEWTAVFIPAMVRAVMLYRSANVDAAKLKEHIVDVVLGGIGNANP